MREVTYGVDRTELINVKKALLKAAMDTNFDKISNKNLALILTIMQESFDNNWRDVRDLSEYLAIKFQTEIDGIAEDMQSANDRTQFDQYEKRFKEFGSGEKS